MSRGVLGQISIKIYTFSKKLVGISPIILSYLNCIEKKFLDMSYTKYTEIKIDTKTYNKSSKSAESE